MSWFWWQRKRTRLVHCIYTYVHMHVHKDMHAHAHTRTCTCIHTCIYTHAHTHVHACIHMHTHSLQSCTYIHVSQYMKEVVIRNPVGQTPTVCEWRRGNKLLASQPHMGSAELSPSHRCLTHHHRCSSGGGILWHCTAGCGFPTGNKMYA